MKTTMIAALALVLLASTAGAALAQDQGGRGGGRHDGGGQDGGGRSNGGQRGGGQREGGQRPQFRDTERRDVMGGQDNRGQRRSEFQADQRPAAQPQAAPPQARPAPAAPAAVQAPQVRERSQFRGGNDGQNRANRDFGAQQRDGNRGAEGARDNNRRGDGARGDGVRGDGVRGDGARGDGNRGDGARDGRRDNDHRDGDRGRGADGRDWNRGGGDRYRGGDHRDDRGRPHWQQGRYPPVYRSHQRYRYGYYRPPIGFYSHSWAFGEFLPRGWYGSQYLLDDWWSYDLPFPPPGYDWVRVGDDALLIDRYSGRVVQVVRDIFW